MMLQSQEDQEIYLVAPKLREALSAEPTFKPALLVTAINRQGVLFVWQTPSPTGPTAGSTIGAGPRWTRPMRPSRRWVRVTANMSLGAYDVAVASGPVAEPVWPDISFQEIIKIAFRDKMISDWDHPVLQRLRGEV